MVAEDREQRALPRALYTQDEVGEMVGLGKDAVRLLIQQGKIPVIHLGRKSPRVPAEFMERLRRGEVSL
ncbi:MAG TPA: excisionase [Chloroflexota bacterium]|nr:excisionase [Chloroflexota bacterium]